MGGWEPQLCGALISGHLGPFLCTLSSAKPLREEPGDWQKMGTFTSKWARSPSKWAFSPNKWALSLPKMGIFTQQTGTFTQQMGTFTPKWALSPPKGAFSPPKGAFSPTLSPPKWMLSPQKPPPSPRLCSVGAQSRDPHPKAIRHVCSVCSLSPEANSPPGARRAGGFPDALHTPCRKDRSGDADCAVRH